MKKIGRGVFATAMIGVCFVGITTSAPTAEAVRFPPWRCPMIYAPVICDGDVIYTNQCFADGAGATGCVPYPWWLEG